MATKLPGVEIGLVLEGLDPEKKYTAIWTGNLLEQISKSEDTAYASTIFFSEETGEWTRKIVFDKTRFDQPAQLKERGFDETRTDICTAWVAVGENETATFELREFGTNETLLKYLVDATGLIIDESDD